MSGEPATAYRHLCVPVDNSEHSHRAVALALVLGRALGARLTGCHVYAARLHDRRFRQMEFTLPARYREEAELERQRRAHDSLIATGLQLISESYLDAVEARARAAGVGFARKTFDGRHWKALVADIQASGYDLVVMGAFGMGAVKESLLGSVTERVVRHVGTDTLVVKALDGEVGPGAPVVVGLDGSPQSFHALRVGLGLARALGRPVEAVAAYDPYLHYALFKSLVGVLSAEARAVFRFREQEELHEEIIDTGLARIYQSHLEVARRLARREGVPLETVLLTGKGFEKVLQHCRARPPWLLVLGRTGAHAEEGETELGSNAGNLLRLAPGNVLLTAGRFTPPADLTGAEMIAWTDEARQRMERVPAHVRGMAQSALVSYAVEQGHTVVTSALVDEAMGRLMPGGMDRLQRLAGEVAGARLSGAGAGPAAVCSGCGYRAKGPAPPAGCPVCGARGSAFGRIDTAALEVAAARQGGAAETEPLPGVPVRWTAEARAHAAAIGDPHRRRQAEARIEKHCRARGIPVITLEVALPIIEETVGAGRLGAAWEFLRSRAAGGAEPAPEEPGALEWTAQARARLERVPQGFMREMTRARIEAAARAQGSTAVDVSLCDAVIAELRRTMCPAAKEGERR